MTDAELDKLLTGTNEMQKAIHASGLEQPFWLECIGRPVARAVLMASNAKMRDEMAAQALPWLIEHWGRDLLDRKQWNLKNTEGRTLLERAAIMAYVTADAMLMARQSAEECQWEVKL
jgi:hypothetical protein